MTMHGGQISLFGKRVDTVLSDLLPAVTYQGAKTRLATAIVDVIWKGIGATYLDLCCGSGAIALTLRSRGVAAEQIGMVDRGPWGLVWQAIGRRCFPLGEMRRLVESMPKNRDRVQPWILARVAEPVPPQPEALFLLIQAAAVGGAFVGIEGDRWVPTSGFRTYWQPTATSSRRSPVNPLMPMPKTILRRVDALVDAMAGVRAFHGNVRESPLRASVVYVDPPYEGMTGYRHGCVNLEQLAERHGGIWVSERRPLGSCSKQMSGARAKGGMTGARKTAHEEWLSWLPASK